MAPFLLFQPLAKRLHQGIETAKRLNLGLFRLGQAALQQLFQPLAR